MRRDGDETRRDETSLYNKGRRLDEVKADNHAFKGWSDVSFFAKTLLAFVTEGRHSTSNVYAVLGIARVPQRTGWSPENVSNFLDICAIPNRVHTCPESLGVVDNGSCQSHIKKTTN